MQERQLAMQTKSCIEHPTREENGQLEDGGGSSRRSTLGYKETLRAKILFHAWQSDIKEVFSSCTEKPVWASQAVWDFASKKKVMTDMLEFHILTKSNFFPKSDFSFFAPIYK